MQATNGYHREIPDGVETFKPASESPPASALRVIRVYRVEGNDPVFVRMLSPSYQGIFTHYYQKRSHYCAGDACRVANHQSDRTWKGYAAAEILLAAKTPVWLPICLEITEYLELDLRGVYERGQLWELYRSDLGKSKKSPVTGKLHGDAPPANLRKPFDVVPCLRALYHRDNVDMKHPSPLPPRVYAEEVAGELPEVLRPKPRDMAPPDQSMAEEFRKRQSAFASGKTSPSDTKKAKGY